MILKFLKPKIIWLAFFRNIIFNSKKVLDIIKLIIIFIITIKNIQSFDINIKKNK